VKRFSLFFARSVAALALLALSAMVLSGGDKAITRLFATPMPSSP